MATHTTNSLRLRQIDARLDAIRAAMNAQAQPRGGWLRTIRNALGMTADQVAKRLDVTPANVTSLEASEAKETISLKRLREVADVLESDLVYVLVPRRPLAQMREERARLVAARILGRVNHMMSLEDQAVTAPELDRQQDELAEDLLESWSRELWDDEPHAR